MLKKDLRLKFLKLREGISSESLINSSLIIANKLLELPIWSFEYYHLFLPISKKKEIDTAFILSILQGKDKNVVLPKIYTETTLEHYLLTDSTKLKKNNLGIPEPVEGIEIATHKIEVVFVPLLAFDKKGNRVGYGKGFYDDFLSKCKPEVIKVGLSIFEAVDLITNVYENDIPLDYCITPQKIYSFIST